MRNAIAEVSPSRSKGFSLVEVATAVALLSIATAFSLPRFNRLASHEPPSAAAKVKLMDLIRGYPASGTSSVLVNWSGFTPAAEPNSLAAANTRAPSGGKCAPPDYAVQSAKNAAAGSKLKNNGC
jgi:prepilin-type N-terminal cleavage/methylation domain-containing protein